MRVKPAEGRQVRDPVTKQLLPAAGRDVPDNQFWRRRLRDGDVVVETAAPPPSSRRTGTEG
jgi:hypothetical protein